jgi:hypothetical protein
MESGYLGQILPMVDQAKAEIRNELENRFDTDRWSDRRNAQLLAELERLSQGVKEQVGGQVEESSAKAFEKSAEAQSSIYTLEGRAANVAMLQLSQEQIRSFVDTPVGGRTLQEWVSRSFDQPLIDKLQEEMGAGLFRGESYRKLADRIDELMDEARTNVETLTRSWVQDANVRAQKQMLDNNRDIIRGWRWDAVLENSSYTKGHGTCLRCMALDADDTVYPLDGGPPIPLHPACRCVRRTITRSWEELGVSREGLDEAVNSLREGRPFSMRGKIDPVTGEFARGKTGTGGVPLIEAGRLRGGYNEFFQRMPEKMQRMSLGPQRYQMLREGKIKLSDLADSSGRQRTIRELQTLAR